MGLFGRSRDEAPAEDSGGDEAEALETSALTPETGAAGPESNAQTLRVNGPWDANEDYPDVPRVDLGGLLIPQSDKIRIQVQADPSSGAVSQLTILSEGSAVQIQPYAAPKKDGMWDEIRGQIVSSINSSGGLVEQQEGSYGTEVRAQVATADGKPQPARFCGIDGPRWFVRLVFLGKAARDDSAAGVLDDIVRGTVVVRGDEAMPMGNSIPLRVPPTDDVQAEQGPTPAPASSERPTITLPPRGPEITETR